MSKIVIQNLNNREIFNSNEEKTLLDTIHDNGIDWMHACGKKGRCTTCKCIIIEGHDYFSPLSEFELKCVASKKIKEKERLSCQCKITGDVIIRVPDESKFPHIEYIES